MLYLLLGLLSRVKLNNSFIASLQKSKSSDQKGQELSNAVQAVDVVDVICRDQILDSGNGECGE